MSPGERGPTRRLQFLLERWVQRGILQQLLLMTGLVASVAALGGVAAWSFTSNFESLATAIWWSFLRLTDPGYLGDDEGVALRIVSTVVTVLGYVLFMGSLIAILTQWLARIIRKLERGLTPIAMENHFVILGWTNRTSEIIRKLLTAAGRMERFFAMRPGTNKLRIVVLANEVDAERRLELRESLGAEWNDSQIFLRSGSSLQHEHLARLDLLRAAVVIIPGADFELGGAELNDARVVKTLLGLDALFRRAPGGNLPCVVAELFDRRKVNIARASIEARSEVITGDRLISRVLSQSLRHAGAGAVLLSLLTHREGNGLYLRSFEQLVGHSPLALNDSFPKAVILGVVSLGEGPPRVQLNPNPDVVLAENDLLLLVGARYDDCEPTLPVSTPTAPGPSGLLPSSSEPTLRRFLILGWSHKVPTLLAELLESPVGQFEITILSRVSVEQRDQALQHLDLSDRLSVAHAVGDHSLGQDLGRLEPHTFDHVLFLASGWMNTSEEADARTVMGLLLLRSLLAHHEKAPEVLVELLDPDNAELLGGAADVILVSPRMLSHLLAHVGLLPELNAVFEDLIGSGGSEIVLRPPSDLGLDFRKLTFAEVQQAAASFGCVGMGFYAASGSGTARQVELNPERTRQRKLNRGDRVILLSTESAGLAG